MKKYHSAEVTERSKFERRCAKLLDELVEAIELHDQTAITQKVTEYFDLKCEYNVGLSSMYCMKRMLRESRFPHVKGTAKAAPPVPDKTPEQ